MIYMFRLEGAYAKNQRRPDIRELNPHIYRYFFSIAAMAEYIGVSRQALKKRLDRIPYSEAIYVVEAGPRFEGRRVVRRKMKYYEWRVFYYLACFYKTPGAYCVQDMFEPTKVLRDFHIAVEDDCLFIVRMFVG